MAAAEEQQSAALNEAQRLLARQQREIEILSEQTRIEVERETEGVARVRAKLDTLHQTLDHYSREELSQLFQAAKDREFRLVSLRSELDGLQYKRSVLIELQRLLGRLAAGETAGDGSADDRSRGPESDLGALLLAHEADNGRIAHWLHDRVAQPLNSLLLHVELWEKWHRTDPDRAVQELDSLRPLAAKLLQDTRRAIFELRPMSLDDLGLLPTLDRYVQLRHEQEQIVVRLQSHGRQRALPAVVEAAVFRIVGAALDNVRDHSGAREALVTLTYGERELGVAIVDHGRGCHLRLVEAASSGGTGLVGMRERARQIGGDITFESGPGQGMTVRLAVPLVGAVGAVVSPRRRSPGNG